LCQRDGCENDIPESSRADARYCSNACRQAVYNTANKDKAKEKRTKVQAVKAQEKQKKQDKKAVDEFLKELMGE
jgi:hypothetical protein